MEKELKDLHQNLQRLVGLHRQLLETIRLEREALVQASLKDIQESTYAKEAIIEGVRTCEIDRMKIVGELALILKKPARDLTLPNIVIAVQGVKPKEAEQLRSAYNALTVLIQRITEQNQSNRDLVEKSLEHVHNMKRNVLGEQTPKAGTYSSHGQKVNSAQGARLISKEV